MPASYPPASTRPLPLTLNLHEELVQVPRVAQTTFSPLERTSVLRPELSTPLTDGLVGDDDSPLSEEIFDVSQAQTETMVEPDSLTDDLWWESESAVGSV